ncbi:EAL domain-containing response regulator [Pseudomonas sp.]|uniref:EAL domain-containing response regulator n=1 Tax=Pseudomonas sp. TaxID=306 RepID=UPI003D124648
MSCLPVRVLIVEAHPFKRRAAAQVFQELGCDAVLLAADAEAALHVLQTSGAVDILLYSLRAQQVADLSAFTALSQRRLFGAVILCSQHEADVHDAIRRLTEKLGVVLLGYIQSPVISGAITPLVSAFIGRPRFLPSDNPRRREYLGPISRAELQEALASQAFKPLFQPTVDLRKGDVRRLNVLSRWAHPRHGWVMPGDFLPLLARAGLLSELFSAQLEQGLEFLQAADRLGHRLDLAFNLPASLCGAPGLIEQVQRAVAQHDIAPARLTFELDEDAVLELSPAVLENLILLRLLGVRLSMAGFGSGFSSLERLGQLPFTEIKLSAVLTREPDGGRRSRAVICSVLALAATLKLSTVVTGVDTQRQRQWLSQLGFTLAQGDLYARAMSAEKLLPWLERQAGWLRKT